MDMHVQHAEVRIRVALDPVRLHGSAKQWLR